MPNDKVALDRQAAAVES